MAKKKIFFQERTAGEIRKLTLNQGYSHRDLVQRIDDLDPGSDALEIRTLMIPHRFRKGNSSSKASRKCYKHGSLIGLLQPSGLQESYGWSDIPLDLRAESFRKLGDMNQADINFVGYSFRPVFGSNKDKRVVPFVNVVEGARIFTYAENYSIFRQRDKRTGEMVDKRGVKVDAYPDAQRVLGEGARVVVHVPSRTEKKQKYTFGLSHVPFVSNPPTQRNNYGLGVSLALTPSLVASDDGIVDGRTQHDKYDVRYTYQNSREGSPVVRFAPQDVAGYLGVVKKQLSEDHNITGLTFNPFALPSQHQADFYHKLSNNVLIYDPELVSKHKLRKLHLAEKSILLARAVGHFGHDDFAYWDPVRDGVYKDFKW
jgi:hypothetical protein|tara:strand:- start:491 stop:1600 length:1110 start_codon:yes stop_codon:yes gene_type:complete